MLSVVSCKKDELPVYEDVSRVYFYWASAQSFEQVNNVMVNLGYDTPMKPDSTIAVLIRVMGRISDVDRPVAVEVIRSESTAVPGEDIEVTGIVPAGYNVGLVYIKLKNTEKLLTNTLQARIRLVPNDYFHVDWNGNSATQNSTSGIEYNVSFDAKTDMPNLWKDAAPMRSYWGTWSRVKELTIYEVLGVTREFFTYDPATESATAVCNSRIPSALAIGMVASVNRYLRKYKEEHDGNPLVDENGLEVKMGVSSII
jgi:hypothetical protein